MFFDMYVHELFCEHVHRHVHEHVNVHVCEDICCNSSLQFWQIYWIDWINFKNVDPIHFYRPGEFLFSLGLNFFSFFLTHPTLKPFSHHFSIISFHLFETNKTKKKRANDVSDIFDLIKFWQMSIWKQRDLFWRTRQRPQATPGIWQNCWSVENNAQLW